MTDIFQTARTITIMSNSPNTETRYQGDQGGEGAGTWPGSGWPTGPGLEKIFCKKGAQHKEGL